jgi:hypothetical protein
MRNQLRSQMDDRLARLMWNEAGRGGWRTAMSSRAGHRLEGWDLRIRSRKRLCPVENAQDALPGDHCR